MLRRLNNKQAQAVLGEYVLIIFLVLGAVTAMTVYFKRSIQASIHDARDYMADEVRQRTEGSYDGELYLHYEPYYTNTSATVTRRAGHITTLLPGGSTGTFRKTTDESTGAEVQSETAPAKDYDLTTPGN